MYSVHKKPCILVNFATGFRASCVYTLDTRHQQKPTHLSKVTLSHACIYLLTYVASKMCKLTCTVHTSSCKEHTYC